jgi:hypothetical protein
MAYTKKSGAAFFSDTPDASFPQPFIDEPRGATDPGVYSDGGDRAVPGAGAALHAGVEV